jgi:quinolinate synthase
MAANFQRPLPEEYENLSREETDSRIAAGKEALKERLLILGHHYQRDDIVKFADLTGDSFKLAKLASERREADYIVFCGVHFMAESADILSQPHQIVILPNLEAGCSMADMAVIEDVEACWLALQEDLDDSVVPVTYINSAADLKAFVGRNGGTVCTSSNAPAALRWAWEQRPRVLFFPDEHLGRNSSLRMGIGEDEMVVWDPRRELGGLARRSHGEGGNSAESLRRARIILWNGHCSVHMRFTTQQIEAARQRFPDVFVIVHPECRREVVDMADAFGSTEQIAKAVREAPSGSVIAVGTEINLVHRLAAQHPDKKIFCLNETVCLCSTMYRIHPRYLAWALNNLVEGRVVNRIEVPAGIAEWARTALDRMLRLA